MRIPGRPSYLAGVNSRRESQRFRQASPTRGVGVEDDEVAGLLGEVVTKGEAGLAAADDDGVDDHAR